MLPVTIVALVLSAIVRLNAALLDDVVQVEIPGQHFTHFIVILQLYIYLMDRFL